MSHFASRKCRSEDPTLADAILDRLVHNAYRLDLKGESMRKTRGLQDGGILGESTNPE